MPRKRRAKILGRIQGLLRDSEILLRKVDASRKSNGFAKTMRLVRGKSAVPVVWSRGEFCEGNVLREIFDTGNVECFNGNLVFVINDDAFGSYCRSCRDHDLS